MVGCEVPANWEIVGTGDFNGDGMSDILWHDTSGNVAIWEMNGTNVLNGLPRSSQTCHPIGRLPGPVTLMATA